MYYKPETDFLRIGLVKRNEIWYTEKQQYINTFQRNYGYLKNITKVKILGAYHKKWQLWYGKGKQVWILYEPVAVIGESGKESTGG